MDRKLRFNKNGKFVIMQVSDTQDLQFARHAMKKMLNIAYDRVDPDLVVLTGDNILGNHLRDARFGSRKVIKTRDGEYEAMKKAISHVVEPLEKRSIPFAMIYGNHDDMNWVTKEEQADIYRAYPFNVGLDDPKEGIDCDTYNIPIYSSTGDDIKYNIWMMDSAGYDKYNDKCYSYVSKAAVDWYVEKSNELKAQNGGKCVDSLMFQHIPFPEAAKLVTECDENDPDVIPFGGNTRDGKRFKVDRNKVKCGVMGEYPACCEENFGQFDAIKKQGDVRAVVFGHDHLNNFEAELDGVNIVQTACASFRCYGDRNRGVRVFILDEKDTSKYETYSLNYRDLCGDGVWSEIEYIWDADGMFKQKCALIAGMGAAAVSLAAAAALGIKKINGRKNK